MSFLCLVPCRRASKAARRAAQRAGAAGGDEQEAARLAAEEAEFERAKVCEGRTAVSTVGICHLPCVWGSGSEHTSAHITAGVTHPRWQL